MKDKTWNRVQFVHLLITITLAFFTVWSSTSLTDKTNKADYNDKAWLAFTEYKHKQNEIDIYIQKSLNEQFEDHGFYTEWFKNSNVLLGEWKKKSLYNQQRLKTKLDLYENVTGITSDARMRATEVILNIKTPFLKTKGQVEGIIKNRDMVARESSKKSRAAGYINLGTIKIKKFKKSFEEAIEEVKNELSSEWVSKT